MGGPAEATYQVTVKHETADALPFNNTSFATFLTRERRKVLTIVCRRCCPTRGRLPGKHGKRRLEVVETFQCEVRPAAEVAKLDEKELRGYAAVCVFSSCPSRSCGKNWRRYVSDGGGLVLVPGGDEMLPQQKQYNEEGMKAGLLPGTLRKIEKNSPDSPLIRWSGFQVKHPIPAFFQKAILTGNPDFGKPQSWPGVNAYWRSSRPTRMRSCLATYADEKRHPALLDRAVGRGHVILFTTPMDTRELDRNRYWHNYWSDSSFGVVLVDQVCRYLAGDSTMPELNYFCGQMPQVSLPSSLSAPPYTLDGPNLAVAETNVKAVEGDTRLSLPQAAAPGNYAVRDAQQTNCRRMQSEHPPAGERPGARCRRRRSSPFWARILCFRSAAPSA